MSSSKARQHESPMCPTSSTSLPNVEPFYESPHPPLNRETTHATDMKSESTSDTMVVEKRYAVIRAA